MGNYDKIEDLVVWQKSRKLAAEIHAVISRKEFNRNFGLKDQMQRSSGSIVDNIAEGHGRRGNREFANFIHYSLGSLNELRSQVYRCYDGNYITEAEKDYFILALRDLEVRISNLLRTIRNSPYQKRKQ